MSDLPHSFRYRAGVPISSLLTKLVLIAAGGAIGALLRYGVAGVVQKWAGPGFPAGTLVINVLGCFLIGLLGALFAASLVREEYRLFVLVGVLGSFTTFSTFGWETFELMNDGQFLRAAINTLASVIIGLAGVWIGYRIGEMWGGG